MTKAQKRIKNAIQIQLLCNQTSPVQSEIAQKLQLKMRASFNGSKLIKILSRKEKKRGESQPRGRKNEKHK